MKEGGGGSENIQICVTSLMDDPIACLQKTEEYKKLNQLFVFFIKNTYFVLNIMLKAFNIFDVTLKCPKNDWVPNDLPSLRKMT